LRCFRRFLAQESYGDVDRPGGRGDSDATLRERLFEVVCGKEVFGIAAGNRNRCGVQRKAFLSVNLTGLGRQYRLR
jgi:hypothetical protein